ncbi:Type II secretion system protein GspH [Rubrivivax sp. A210]|uniref:prepilin-type N-terminal cleavage/methylation domain-containing protein n=1 Tax=Rubrivivax sp. A210 TaxID=2772301 RepID=UPI00191AC8FD|nr:prepilin-type N-terminal cleavage/methylation domain-containing protein [Rubrivivax sp. A210]CAD5372571.1 Type II secretion system protein GspH [Rubrivivax sp. A210]
MPTSAPGSNADKGAGAAAPRRGAAGFTLVELLIVIAIIAVSVGLVAMSLPDGDAGRLDEEGARLSALLEMARAEARVSGVTVRWVPRGAGEAEPMSDSNLPPSDFRFIGLPAALAMPTRWLDARVAAQVAGGASLLLGPEAILPPQRVVLSLGERRLELASDGLGPFVMVEGAAQP